MSKVKVAVLCTGGTFDKVYLSQAGARNFAFPDVSATQKIVARLGLDSVEVFYNQENAKDSQDMTDGDREFIAEWCLAESRERSVVIHGTDTMLKSAQVVVACMEQRRETKKVVVFTGAHQPACVRDSDAEFNFGCALMASQICLPGVYIVMDGGITVMGLKR